MADISLLRKRAKIIQETREFFISNRFLEVETPVLSPHLIPESHLEVFSTSERNPYREEREFYLTPSPEIWMKKLLAEGSGSIFQITKSFRNSEQKGSIHNPEFTMMEWYAEGACYRKSITIMEELLSRLSQVFGCAEISPPVKVIQMKELFLEHTGIDIGETFSRELLFEAARKNRFSPDKSYGWEELFNWLFVSYVEPEIPKDSPVIVTDYPEQIPCLAKKSRKGPWYERWELYLRGIETANCYTEETDKKLAELFFREQSALKKEALVKHKVDRNYTDIFSAFPECSGTALGIDRLVMAITGAKKIQNVISYTF